MFYDAVGASNYDKSKQSCVVGNIQWTFEWQTFKPTFVYALISIVELSML